jgi:hypothetical protein
MQNDLFDAATVGWVVPDRETADGRLRGAFAAWAIAVKSAGPGLGAGPDAVRIGVAPLRPADPEQCLRAVLTSGQVHRLIALLDRDTARLDAAADREDERDARLPLP